jgi:hypothetical protein
MSEKIVTIFIELLFCIQYYHFWFEQHLFGLLLHAQTKPDMPLVGYNNRIIAN